MSYLQFHILFILPPILLLALTLPRPLSAYCGRGAGLGLVLIPLVALVYTAPWDNYLISQGVWDYGEERVIGTLGYVPLEEYAFFLLQPLLAGLWLYHLLARRPGERPERKERTGARVVGTLVCLLLGLAGFLLLWWKPGYYLGLILAWAAPALAVQWAYGGGFVWARREVWLLGVAAPTVYLWVADRLAIGFGIWSISPEHTTGLAPFGLPVEEAVFFATTNLLVVGGLLAYLRLTERLGLRRPPDGMGGARRSGGALRQPPRPMPSTEPARAWTPPKPHGDPPARFGLFFARRSS